MTKKIFLPVLLACSLVSISLLAQPPGTVKPDTRFLRNAQNIRKFYVAGGLDAAIFSSSIIHHDAVGTTPAINTIGTLRFTYFVNVGLTLNFNFSKHVGLFTGADVKNIGYIEQTNGYSEKRRVYTIGAPLGLKFGNMAHHKGYVFLGGGLDFPFNYQEKYFSDNNRYSQTRLNEWFSDRTPDVMPYVFFGAKFSHGITAKVQYYPNNFMNPDFTNSSGVKPYYGTDVNLILFTIGFSMMHAEMHHHQHEHHHHHQNNYNNNSYYQ